MSSGLNLCPSGTYLSGPLWFCSFSTKVFSKTGNLGSVSAKERCLIFSFFFFFFLVLDSNLRNEKAPLRSPACYKCSLFIIKFQSPSVWTTVPAPGLTGAGQPGWSGTTWSACPPSFEPPAQCCTCPGMPCFPWHFPTSLLWAYARPLLRLALLLDQSYESWKFHFKCFIPCYLLFLCP